MSNNLFLALAHKAGAAKTLAGAEHAAECEVCEPPYYDDGAWYWCAEHPDYEPPQPRDPNLPPPNPADLAQLEAVLVDVYVPVVRAELERPPLGFEFMADLFDQRNEAA